MRVTTWEGGAQAAVTTDSVFCFVDPRQLLADESLTPEQKRAILCTWCSDASAVPDRPTMRWLRGTPAPVPYTDIRAALVALETGETSAPEPEMITVEPVQAGWLVRSAALGDQVFRRGASAERAAKRLAESIANAGLWAEVRITLRDGSIAGRFVCAPPH